MAVDLIGDRSHYGSDAPAGRHCPICARVGVGGECPHSAPIARMNLLATARSGPVSGGTGRSTPPKSVPWLLTTTESTSNLWESLI